MSNISLNLSQAHISALPEDSLIDSFNLLLPQVPLDHGRLTIALSSTELPRIFRKDWEILKTAQENLHKVEKVNRLFRNVAKKVKEEYMKTYFEGWKNMDVARDLVNARIPNFYEDRQWRGKSLALSHCFVRMERSRSDREIPEPNSSLIIDLLQNNEANLSRLVISNCKIHNSIGQIALALQSNTTVSTVILNRNQITSDEALLLVEALGANGSIKHLNLSNPSTDTWFLSEEPNTQNEIRAHQFNQIDDACATALVGACLNKKGFVLNLRGNPISEECATGLKTAMELAGNELKI